MSEHSINQQKNFQGDSIAIIGMGCLLPGISGNIESVEQFEAMLLSGLSPIRGVPKERWNNEDYFDTDNSKENKLYTQEGTFLENIDLFDAEFFNLHKKAVNTMDPQQRIFLETSLLALNHANIAPHSLKGGAVGVYCGVTNIEYAFLNFKHQYEFGTYTGLGMASNSIPGRLSHFLDLKGPSLSVDTACSASLTALHLAANDLKNHKTNMVIVGGVHLNLVPELFIIFSKANMTSPTGQCRCFDKAADGFVRGEGCVTIVMKRLEDAIKNNDEIYAIVNASAMNHDGKSGKGFFAPSVDSQVKLQNMLLSEANLAPEQIDYIEAHGTGTKVGDRIELESITQVHQKKHSQERPLIVGSVKNITGHTMCVSGLTSLLKVIMALKHEIIPANWNFNSFPEGIDSSLVPLKVPTENLVFRKKSNQPRHVMISNFGVSGTNVGIIVREGIENIPLADVEHPPEQLCFVLSGNSEKSLRLLCKSYIRYLADTDNTLASICFTQALCRDHYRYRVAFKVATKAELIEQLSNSTLNITQVIPKENLSQAVQVDDIIEAYLKGMTINWDKVYKRHYPKVDIPQYCFDRKSYWFKKALGVNQDKNDEKPSVFISKETLKQCKINEQWIFQGQWQMSTAELTALDSYPLYVWEQLPKYVNKQKIELPILNESSLHNLLPDSKLIYFVSSRSKDHAEQSTKELYQLIKRLDENNCQCQIVIVTLNAMATNPDETVDLMSCPISGFVKTLYLELPHFRPIQLDCDQNSLSNILSVINQELSIQGHSHYETIVAYRNQQRHNFRLKSLEKSLNNKRQAIDPHGVYLITGGFGGLGSVALNYLLLKGAAKVVIVARSIRDSNHDIPLLESAFPEAKIYKYAVDISDFNAVDKLLDDIKFLGPLKGIIHTAGIGVRKAILSHNEDDFTQLFKGKVEGAWTLHALTEKNHSPLDFFVVYSSISSLLGSNREAVYAAANEYLNAFVHYRRQKNLVASAICWGPWGDVGMARDRSRTKHVKSALITNEQGLGYLDFCINHNHNDFVIISPAFLRFMLDFVPRPLTDKDLQLSKLIQSAESIPPAGTTEQPISNQQDNSQWLDEYWQLNESIKHETCVKMITDLANELLSVEPNTMTDPNLSFFDLGFDSILMADLAAKIQEKLNNRVETSLAMTFDYPTMNKLADFIYQSLSEIKIEQKPTLKDVTQDIAIIGMSCRFPKAENKEAFLTMLLNGEQGFSEIPESRWDNSLYYDSTPGKAGKSYVKEMAFISDETAFDATFFNMSPRECIQCDPQHRIFLELAYHALEDANITPSSVKGSNTAVFAAGSKCGYMERVLYGDTYPRDLDRTYLLQGSAPGLIAGRVSYFFDFKGKTEVIDTGCASALNALHNACLSLQSQECDLAMVGGVSLLYSPETTVNYCAINALSPDNRCYSFDARANGYVRGEGGAIVILKRLNEAIDDNDKIYAVIKGSGVNSDGKSIGLLAPSGKSQVDVALKALENSGVNSKAVSYIEAHGAASFLGDSIELSALNEVYGKERSNDNSYYVGSVKANIGNLEIASGIASLVKTALSLEQRKLFKQINFNQLNPEAPQNSFIIAKQTTTWRNNDNLNTAAINSYGFSGTNAHVIIQEYPRSQKVSETRFNDKTVLVISAKSKDALMRLKSRYQNYLLASNEQFIDIAYSAFYGREHYAYRIAVIARTNQEAYEKLSNNQYSEAYVKDIKTINVGEQKSQEFAMSWLNGGQVDFIAAFSLNHSELKQITLPLYPFEREHYDISEYLDIQNQNLPNKSESPKLQYVEEKSSIIYKKVWVNLFANNLPSKVKDSIFVIGPKRENIDKIMEGVSFKYIVPEKIKKDSKPHLLLFFDDNDLTLLVNNLKKIGQINFKSFTLVTDSAFYISDNDSINPISGAAYALWKTFAKEYTQLNSFFIDANKNSKLKQLYFNMIDGGLKDKEYALRENILVPRLKVIAESVQKNEQSSESQNDYYVVYANDLMISLAIVDQISKRGVNQFIVIVDDEDNQSVFEEHTRALQTKITYIINDGNWVDKLNGLNIRPDSNLRLVYTLPKIEANYIFQLDEHQFSEDIYAFNNNIQDLMSDCEKITIQSITFLSSFCSSFGVEGHALYGVMSSILNSYAIKYTLKGQTTKSINIGPWKNVTFASDYVFYGKRYCFVPLDTEVIGHIPALMKEKSPNLWVMQLDWNLYLKGNTHDVWLYDHRTVDGESNKALLFEKLSRIDNDKRYEAVVPVLSAVVKETFKLPLDYFIDEQTNLYELGLDSISAIEIKNKMQMLIGEDDFVLEIEYFTSRPSIENISSYIVKAFRENQLSTETKIIDLYHYFPLTYMQLEFWFSMKNGFFNNVIKPMRIHHKICLNSLRKAVNYLFQAYEVLRLEVSYDKPMQRIVPYVEHEIYYYDISEETNKDFLLTQSFSNQRNLFLGIDGIGTLFIDVFKLSEDVYEIHIIGTHFIFDERGLHRFSELLLRYYTTFKNGETPTEHESADNFYKYVRKENKLFEKNIAQKTQFWKKHNQGFGNYRLDSTKLVKDTYIPYDYLVNFHLNTQTITSFINYQKHLGINPTYGLIALLQIVLYKLNGKEKLMISMLHTGRSSTTQSQEIGLYLTHKQLNLLIDKELNFSKLVKNIEDEVLFTTPYQHLPGCLKKIGTPRSKLKWYARLVYPYYYYKTQKNYKDSWIIQERLNQQAIDSTINRLSAIRFRIRTFLKDYLRLPISISKQTDQALVVNISSKFFIRTQDNGDENTFYTQQEHMESLNYNRGPGLTIFYFTTNYSGEYFFSIRGPMTTETKQFIANEFNCLMKEMTTKSSKEYNAS